MHSYLTTQLRKLKMPATNKKFSGESYIGNNQSKLLFWNITTPDVRQVFKKSVLLLSEQPATLQFKKFEKVWFESNNFEVRMIALYWLESLSNRQLVQFTPKIIKWASKIDNWADSDTLCGIYARIFEASPKSLLKTYKVWNKDKNPWLRRCSMVGIFYYSRFRKKVVSFPFAVSMIKPHLDAKEHYIQKAVGWTIRETYNVHPIETIKFINDNLTQIQPGAWFAASEKLPIELRKKLVEERKNLRKLGE